MKVTLVTMTNPCSACLIATDLLKGLFEKLSREEALFFVNWEILHINHPREFAKIEGLEVERLPAVLIDGEQITAGGLMHRRQMIAEIELRR